MSGSLQPDDFNSNDRATRTGLPAAFADDVGNAELAPDPPSPFAFGLQALLALVAIASVQFALMAYLTPMVGLLVGMAVCVLAMPAMVVVSICLRLKPGSRLLDQMDRIAIRLVVGIVILFFGTILAGGGQLVYIVLEDARFAWQMQHDLGFTYAERTLFDPSGEGVINALEVTSVATDGPLDQAGVRQGDLILLEATVEYFLTQLNEQRGQAVDISLANYAAGTGDTDIDEASERSVTVHVPR